MAVRFPKFIGFLVVLLVILGVSLVEANAQKKKRRTRRASKPVAAKPVITNPPIAPPGTAETASTGEVKIISTADQNATDPEQTTEPVQPKKPTSGTADQDIKQTITTLSNQVNRLTDKLTQIQEDDRYQLEMERLTRAEQRAEQLRSQLIDIQSKIADFESKLEQIEYALKPENIDRTTQGYGTVHPEEARDARKRQLEGERSRVQAQLKIVENGRARLEVAVATADSEVDTLRAKLNQQREQIESAPKVESTPRRKP